MKFGKEFKAQMVPEWQEKYMNYNFLKTLLKDIHEFRLKNKPAHHHNLAPHGLKRTLSMYRAFSGLLHAGHSSPPRVSPSSSPDDIESQAILVNSINRDGTKKYETTFLMASDVGGEYELVYFRRLDEDFYKVEKFYKAKLKEVMEEAALLNKQMDALIAFRVKVENPIGWNIHDRTIEMTRLANDVTASAASLASTTPSGIRASRRVHVMDMIEEASTHHERTDESTHHNRDEDDDENGSNEDEEDQKKEDDKITKKAVEEKPMKVLVRHRPAPLEILERVKINNTNETPRSTLKTVLKVPQNTELKFTRENLRKVEDQLKQAFVHFYQKLRLLKSYSFLNTLAFSKIMKKYDKITERDAAQEYMKMVDNSVLGTSDDVNKLMERVEATFIKHFCNSNRSKGMRVLRPKPKKERHRTTFTTGFLSGCTASLIVALGLVIRARHILDRENEVERDKYMKTLFPLYSLFGFIVLHLLLYAANIYFWRRYRVNYSFIFGFKQGTEITYRQVMLISFGIATIALIFVLLNLDLEMDPKTLAYQQLTELLPMFLVILLLVILLLPFKVLYHSSRFFFLTCALHGIAAPLYKVTLPDFFLADQITSQVQAIRSLEFYICYYGWGDYKHRVTTCKESDIYNTFYYIVAAIPYWVRLLQCLRRLFEEKDVLQGVNGLKYFLTIVAVCLRTAYSLNKSYAWGVIAMISSVVAAIFCTYWDLVYDWGLLDRHSKNRWLRDKLLVPHKSVYYAAIVLNVLLRFAWLQTVLNIKMFSLHRETWITIVASLEIIRRGIWNFFRLENEHLNNVGKYRAFKSVPLPFNYDEDDDKDD